MADQNYPQGALNANQIHHILDVSQATIIRGRKRFAPRGLDAAIEELSRCGRPLNSMDISVQITALACSTPPEGHSHGSLRLLEARLVELDGVEDISDETVGVIFKKTIEASPQKAMVYRRVDASVLVHLYSLSYDPMYPLICVDERSC